LSAPVELHKEAIRILMGYRSTPGSHRSWALLADHGIDPHEFDPDVALGAFSRQLNRATPDERLEAVRALVWMFERRAISPLLRALMDPNWDVRLLAAGGLLELSPVPPWAIDPLDRAAVDAESAVRAMATDVLGRSQCLEALGPLTRGLYDFSRQVRLAAAQGLRSLGALGITSFQSAALLASRLRDESDPFVSCRLYQALEQHRSEAVDEVPGARFTRMALRGLELLAVT
jgi:HEAT repeat protein